MPSWTSKAKAKAKTKGKRKASSSNSSAPPVTPSSPPYFLNGATLQPPTHHTTDWKDGQHFTVEDDVDRTALPWEPPAFISSVDPRSRHPHTTVTDFKILQPKSKHAGVRFAKVVHNVLTEAECASLIAAVNTKGFTPVLLNAGGGAQMMTRSVRDGHRVIVDNAPLADWLFKVLEPHMPSKLGVHLKLVDLNERLRFLCYTPGQYFAPHLDGNYARPKGHQDFGASSKVTIQLYLHDVPRSHGGSTTFVRGGVAGGGDDIACQPRAGSVLLFTQNLLHEGAKLDAGLKYTMRTEAMYAT